MDPLLDGLAQGLVDDPGQAFLHHLVAENVASVDFSRLGVGIVQGGEIRFVAGNGSNGIAAALLPLMRLYSLGGLLFRRNGCLYSNWPVNGRGERGLFLA